MDMVLRAVLASGNKEQNQAYPPNVFTTHFNVVTAFLLDEITKQFPVSQSVIDLGRPFLKEETGISRDGSVVLPEDYRNFLSAGIFVTPDQDGPCDPNATTEEAAACEDESCDFPNDPLAPSVTQIVSSQLAGRCRMNPVTIVDIDEWDHRTNHKYKAPTIKKPIGCLFEGTRLKICPFEVPNIQIRYLRHPRECKYGYRLNPDDTYSYDPGATTESEWTDNAMQYLVKGVSTLYSIFTRDGELRDGILELKKAGLF